MTPLFLVCWVGFTLVGLTMIVRRKCEWVGAKLVVVASMAPLFNFVVLHNLEWLTSLNLPNYDLYVFKADALMGSPGFRIAQLVQPHHIAMSVLEFVYRNILAAVLLTAGMLVLTGRPVRRPLSAFFVNAVLAPLVYLVFPVCGPLFTFPKYPVIPQNVSAHKLYVSSTPNSIPSVHMSTALLVLVFCWDVPIVRYLGLAFAILTTVATVANGQHYFIDLVSAVPWAVGALYVTHAFPVRTAAIKLSATSRKHAESMPQPSAQL